MPWPITCITWSVQCLVASVLSHTEDVKESRTYEDRRPYAVPLRLADLAGPAYGVVELPLTLAWTGRRDYDLEDPADTNILYERVIVEAVDADDLSRLLNADRLRATWSQLFLPPRVRRLWETQFPELSAAA